MARGLASLLWLVASAALAAPRMAVIDLASPPSMLGLASQITQSVVKAAKAQGYAVLPPDDVLATLGEKPYEELQNCGGRPACVAAKLAPLGIDRAVVGTFNRDEKSYLVKLWLIDVHGQSVITDVDRSILIASRRLMQDVNAAVPGFVRGEKEARGTLKISANAKNVDVTLDGEPVGKTPLAIELKPGKHEVKLEKKAYLPITRLVDVEPNAVTDEQFRLTLIPGETPEEEALPTLVAQPEKSQGGLRVPTSAFVAVGFGAAAAIAGGIVGYLSSHDVQQLQASYDPTTGIYGGTRAQALRARSEATYANILFIAAGVGVVTGAVLTLVDSGSGDTVKAAAVAGPGGGGLVLEGRF